MNFDPLPFAGHWCPKVNINDLSQIHPQRDTGKRYTLSTMFNCPLCIISLMIEPAFLDIDTEEESMRRTRGTFGCILMILTRVYWTEICDGMQMKMSERYVIASVNGVCESAKLHRAQQTRQVSIIISCSVWFLPSPIKVSSATIYLSIIYFYILYFKLYCKCGRFFHAIHQRTLPMKSMMQLNTWKALSGHCIKARKRYVLFNVYFKF